VDIGVRTRGRQRDLDYRFVGGEAPEDFWWRAYGPVTDIERPTILVRSNGASWQAYIAGIRSRRFDITDNSIQYSLVLAGDCGDDADNDLALHAVTRSAAALAETAGQYIPGDLLDGRLPADEVDRLLASPGKESAAIAADAVRAAYAPVTAEPPAAGGSSPATAPDAVPPGVPPAAAPAGDWIGGLGNPAARTSFAALARELLRGGVGRAVTLNLVESDTDLAELPGWEGTLGVLAAPPGTHLDLAVQELGKAGSPPREDLPAGERTRRRSGRRPRKRTLAAMTAIATVVAAAVILWLVLSPPR
jgi:hypothetical protein